LLIVFCLLHNVFKGYAMVTISNNRPGELVILGARQDEIEKFLAAAKRALPNAVVHNLGGQRQATVTNCECQKLKPGSGSLGIPVLNFGKPKEEEVTNARPTRGLGIPRLF
jgi:hypothetical protein